MGKKVMTQLSRLFLDAAVFFFYLSKKTHTQWYVRFLLLHEGGGAGRAGGRARGSHVESEWRLNGTEEAFFFLRGDFVCSTLSAFSSIFVIFFLIPSPCDFLAAVLCLACSGLYGRWGDPLCF